MESRLSSPRPERRAVAFLTGLLLFGSLVGCSGHRPTAERTPSPPRHPATSQSTIGSGAQYSSRHHIYHGTLANYTRLFVACMRSEGWQAVADPDLEGWGINYLPQSQWAAEQHAVHKCNERVGSIPPPPVHPSRAFVLTQCQWQLITRKCLIRQGLPVTSPPSFDRYDATYATGPWSAYDVITSRGYTFPSTQSWGKINRECPQGPSAYKTIIGGSS